MHKILWYRFFALCDVLFGTQPFQPLPEAYFQQTDWSSATRGLQMPAAWRRQSRVR